MWHDITTLRMHARSDDVGHGMTSLILDSTHSRQRRAWHDITSLGQHTRSAMSGVACITALGQHTRSDDVGRVMISPHLDGTHDRTTSGVALHHRFWTASRVGNVAWHDIPSLGQHTRSDDVGRDMPSPPLGSTHDRMTSGVAFHHRLWVAQMVE